MNKLFNLFRKPKEDDMLYRKRTEEYKAWQFTKENIRKGVPDFIRLAPNKPFTFYSQYGGEVIYGILQTSHGEIEVRLNDYLFSDSTGTIYGCGPIVFQDLFAKI